MSDLTRTPGAPIPPLTTDEANLLLWIAEHAAASGLYEGPGQNTTATASQLFLKLLYGRDLGVTHSAALDGINIIGNGGLELSTSLQAALVRAHPHYDFKVVELTDESCRIDFHYDRKLLGASSFTMADARRAELADGENYRRYPRNMLYARAMSNGIGWYCPDIANGPRPYAPGELSRYGIQPAGGGRPGLTVVAGGQGSNATHADAASPTAAAGAFPARAPVPGASSQPAAPARPRPAGDVERATTQQLAEITALGARAGLSDAQLFNVLVVTGGGHAVQDSESAARQLDLALHRLPKALVTPVVRALTEIAQRAQPPARDGERALAQAPSGDPAVTTDASGPTVPAADPAV